MHTRSRARTDAERADADILGIEAALPRMIDTGGDRFRITINGHDYDSHSDAAHALADWARGSELKWAARYTTHDFGAIGRISSFNIRVATRPGLGSIDVLVSLADVPRSVFVMTKESFLKGGLGLIQRVQNHVSGIPALLDQAHEDAEQRIGRPFRHSQALAEAEEDLIRVETQLAAMQKETPPTQSEPARAELTVDAVRAYEPNLGTRQANDAEPAPQWSEGSARSKFRSGPTL